MGNIYSERIEWLRNMMRAKDWDAVLITGSDPHGSEYPGERWKQVQWISGFTGEAGDVVITADHAGLWTDTRYFIQAEAQLQGTGIELHKTRIPGEVLIPEWLGQTFGEDFVIALDGLCVGVDTVKGLPGTVVNVPDMLSVLWSDRPEIPQTPVYTVNTGESRAEKLDWLREFLSEKGCSGMLVTALDEIAWLLNIRASDIEYNPYAISYLLVTAGSATWYLFKSDEWPDWPDNESLEEVEADGVSLQPYSNVAWEFDDFDGRLFVDSSTLNWNLYGNIISSGVEILEGVSPIGLRKAVKNLYEVEKMREVHLLDGIAMERFLYWLETSVQGGMAVSERDAAVMLRKFKAGMPGYIDDSFETISAYGAGAALPHYVTPLENAPLIEGRGLYLCDSGAHYDGGTTDITRTVPMGECSELEKEDYTLVLKGHIDLAMAVFPAGTPGCRIDALAREPLWRSRRNFGHGTGHGVGFLLGVHEGPQDIRQNLNPTPLMPGMITSNEPGIYREGMHGVRHENLLLCTDAGGNEFGDWRAFETLTLCHFDTSALLVELLDKEEREWLNAYNARVFELLGERLDEDVREWLRLKTLPV